MVGKVGQRTPHKRAAHKRRLADVPKAQGRQSDPTAMVKRPVRAACTPAWRC